MCSLVLFAICVSGGVMPLKGLDDLDLIAKSIGTHTPLLLMVIPDAEKSSEVKALHSLDKTNVPFLQDVAIAVTDDENGVCVKT
jgi:hypothetical protein